MEKMKCTKCPFFMEYGDWYPEGMACFKNKDDIDYTKHCSSECDKGLMADYEKPKYDIKDITENQLKDLYINMNYEEIAEEDQDTMQEANYSKMIFQYGEKFYAIWITQYWGSVNRENIYLDLNGIVEVKRKTITKQIWAEVE